VRQVAKRAEKLALNLEIAKAKLEKEQQAKVVAEAEEAMIKDAKKAFLDGKVSVGFLKDAAEKWVDAVSEYDNANLKIRNLMEQKRTPAGA